MTEVSEEIREIAERGHLDDLKRRSYETPNQRYEFDYGANTDEKPVYWGSAPPATPTSVRRWKITKFRYDGQNRVVGMDERDMVIWDNRADPTLDGKAAWLW